MSATKELAALTPASTVRDKIFAYAVGRRVSQQAIEEYGEDHINSRALAPLCIMDIAYGIWQEKFENMPVRHEMKILKKRVHKLFHEGIFARNGVIYASLNEDEICFMSDYADKINEAIKDDLTKLYYTLQSKTMDMPAEQRDVLCNILVMETVLLIAQSNLHYDWQCQYPILDKAVTSLFRMAQVYRHQVLGNKDTDIEFGDNDEHFINAVKIIHQKIYKVAV